MFETKVKAPPLVGKEWLNVSRPITWQDLQGKIVLLDFWTFCCSDCMHLLPYLKQLEERFAAELVVIGVHSGKFDNERSSDAIRNAMLRYGIKHPVVNDRSYALWESFYVREWPTLVLVDPDGYIVKKVPCSEFPSGKFDEPIQSLIEEYDSKGKLNRSRVDFYQLESLDASDSRLKFPGKVTCDITRIVISDTGNHRLVVCDKSGRVTDVIGSGSQGFADGAFQHCQFNNPQGVCISGDLIFVADTENHRIRRVNLKTKQVDTIAGNGQQAAYLSGSPAGDALKVALSSPWDLVLRNGNISIAMAGTHQLWELDLSQSTIAVLAGTGEESLRDGPAEQARLSQPSALSVQGEMLFFADAETSSIRKLTPGSTENLVQTIVGRGLFDFGDLDGPLSTCQLQHPLGVCATDGFLYVADSYNHKVKTIDLSAKLCNTIYGGAPSDRNSLSEPGGLCLYDEQVLLIADTNNHVIKCLNLVDDSCETLKLDFGQIPNPTGLTRLPNLIKRRTVEYAVSPNDSLTLEMRLELDSNIHINEQMPVTYALASKVRNEEVSFIKGSSASPVWTMPLTKIDDGGTMSFELAVTAYVCGNDAACYVQSFAYDIELKAHKGANLSTVALIEKLKI